MSGESDGIEKNQYEAGVAQMGWKWEWQACEMYARHIKYYWNFMQGW